MVTLLAFGRKGYAHAANNMVASIRFHGYQGPIHLHVGRALMPYISPHTAANATIHELSEEYTADPGWCKINLPKIIQGDTLYLDVDGVCLKDLTPLIKALKKDGRAYITSVMGKGKLGDTIGYYEWASPQKVAEKHLAHEGTFYGIQSSWAYFRKGELLDTFHRFMVKAWEQWSVKDLKHQWGKGKPDELFYSIACTLLQHDPSFEHVVHFGKGFDPLPKIRENYYILSLYGVGRGRGSVPPRFVECYDAEIRTIQKSIPSMLLSRAEPIRKDKYCNFKN